MFGSAVFIVTLRKRLFDPKINPLQLFSTENTGIEFLRETVTNSLLICTNKMNVVTLSVFQIIWILWLNIKFVESLY